MSLNGRLFVSADHRQLELVEDIFQHVFLAGPGLASDHCILSLDVKRRADLTDETRLVWRELAGFDVDAVGWLWFDKFHMDEALEALCKQCIRFLCGGRGDLAYVLHDEDVQLRRIGGHIQIVRHLVERLPDAPWSDLGAFEIVDADVLPPSPSLEAPSP